MSAAQIGAWSTETDDHDNFLLVRLYGDGSMTAAAKVDGVYGPEYPLVAEAGWWTEPTRLTVVS